MSELKTVEHDGKVYQIGAVYEFSGGLYDDWHAGILVSISGGEDFTFKSESDVYPKIRETKAPIGTITDAPLKPEDGEWYMCESKDGELKALYFDGVLFTSAHHKNGDSCGQTHKSYKPLYKMVRG